MRWLLLLTLLGCGKPAADNPAGTTSSPDFELVEVAAASDIQPSTVRFVIKSDGALFRDGVATSLEDLPEYHKAGSLSTEPKLIVADPSLKFRAIGPLLNALLVKGGCVNLSFLVRARGREAAVPIAVRVDDHFCHALVFHEGPLCVNEHPTGNEHLWIEVGLSPHRAVRIDSNPPGSVYFPDAEETETKSSPQERPPWTTEPLPATPLTANSIHEFVAREAIRTRSPVLVLELGPEDGIGEALSFISSVRLPDLPVLVEFRGF